jgi:hypothetical protein
MVEIIKQIMARDKMYFEFEKMEEKEFFIRRRLLKEILKEIGDENEGRKTK